MRSRPASPSLGVAVAVLAMLASALAGGRGLRAQPPPCAVVNGDMERVSPQLQPASWQFAGRVRASERAHGGRRSAAFLGGWDDIYQPLTSRLAPGVGPGLSFWVYREPEVREFQLTASVGGVMLPVTVTESTVPVSEWVGFHVTVPPAALVASASEVRFHFSRGSITGQAHLDDVVLDLCAESTLTPSATSVVPASPSASATPATAATPLPDTATPTSTAPASHTPTASRTPTATATRTVTPSPTRSPSRAPAYLPMALRSRSSAAARPRTWGVQLALEDLSEDFESDVALALPRARQVGMSSVRTHLRWADVEPRNAVPSAYDWRASDARMRAYADAGFEALVSIVDYPPWATRYACGGDLMPGMDVEWREFVREAARHFGAAPYRVSAWEIGNEVDGETLVRADDHARDPEWGGGQPTVPHGGCWGGRAGAYRAFLQSAYEEIKAVDPLARVTIGGLANADLSHVDGVRYPMFDMTFLDALLAAGGGGYFDFLSYHWFPDVPGQRSGVAKAHDLLDTLAAYGCPKPLWLTETYRLHYPADAGSDARQVDFMTRELMPVLGVPELERIYWYGWVDFPPRYETSPNVPDRGLVRADYTTRPALPVLAQVIAHTNGRPSDVSTAELAAYRFTWRYEPDDYVVSAHAGTGRLALPVPAGTRATVTSCPMPLLQRGGCAKTLVDERDARIELEWAGDALFVHLAARPAG